MYTIKNSIRFRKDYKKIRRNAKFDKNRLEFFLTALVKNKPLDSVYRNHKITGEYEGCFECHICPDILLIYKINQASEIIYLVRIGSHSEIFG